MLTVYSTQGSPGASTTAMHLAAHWASSGREVLLIETDPAGGSLSHNLGIQFTPGSASFVASGLTVQSNHLIDHAQDVLFESLHVMPAPASPTGARGIFEIFAAFAGDLRTISENEMAVIIDGGRISADTAASALTTEAAGVVVVCRDSSQLSSVDHLTEALAAAPGDGPAGRAVTVGKSPMSAEEWQESCGLAFCGSIEIVSDMATDLSAYLTKGKRKSKKWRASLEQVGKSLYEHAHPPMSDRSRRARPAEPGTDSAEDTDGSARAAAAASGPPAGHDPAAHAQAPPMAPPEDFPAHGRPVPPMAPAPGAGFDPSHHPQPTPDPQPDYTPSHHPLALDPRFTPARFNLANLLNEQRRNPEAETVLRGGIEFAPDEAELHYSLGLLLAEEGRLAEAVDSLSRAAVPTARARVHYNYGLALQQAGRLEEAEAALREARRRDDRDPDVALALARLLMDQQRWGEAGELAAALVRLVPGAPGPQRLLNEIRIRERRSRQ